VVRHPAGMGSDSQVLDMLERADAAGVRPRLGGMARPDGVIIASEHFWAFAGRDGTIRVGAQPARRSGIAGLPLVRGLVRLAGSVTPLLSRRGVARRRERRLLLVAIGVGLLAAVLPGLYGLAIGLAATGAMLALLFRGRTLRLHGAEHRAIAAAEDGQLVRTWTGDVRPSRFAARCGTNFAAIAVPLTLLFEAMWPPAAAVVAPAVVPVAALAVSMELWQLVHRPRGRVLRFLLLPGLGLQRLTTREPALDDTRVALRATAAVLERELAA
jgi:uncharacterized protein YqhQ